MVCVVLLSSGPTTPDQYIFRHYKLQHYKLQQQQQQHSAHHAPLRRRRTPTASWVCWAYILQQHQHSAHRAPLRRRHTPTASRVHWAEPQCHQAAFGVHSATLIVAAAPHASVGQSKQGLILTQITHTRKRCSRSSRDCRSELTRIDSHTDNTHKKKLQPLLT
jgi:hypothetical protein